MATYSRDYYVNLVENEYFGNVTGEDVAAVLRCFTDQARVVIYHGDAPARRFAAAPGGGESPLVEFYDHLLANYAPRFTGFCHYVDAASERCAATFDVELSPKAGSPYREPAPDG